MKIFNRKFTNDLWGVFSTTVFCTYSWSMLIFFWDVPSFLLRYNTGEIISYLAYQFMFALLESTIVTIFVTVIGFIFPAKFLRNKFRATGTALVFAFAINAIYFKHILDIVNWVTDILSIDTLITIQIVTGIWAVCLVVLPIGLVMASKRERVEKIVNQFVDRLSILVSIYLFLSLLGILLIIVRNIS